MIPEKTWIVELEEDPETGDLVMPLPPAMLKELGWDIGDTLTWEQDKESKDWKLSKKPVNVSDE